MGEPTEPAAVVERATSPRDYGVEDAIDIGGGVQISFVVDRDENRVGVHTWHDCETDYSAGYVPFDTDAGRLVHPNGPRWTVESSVPLTLSPSILCGSCGLHGFIRAGEWVPA
jgi:hypothetical protein